MSKTKLRTSVEKRGNQYVSTVTVVDDRGKVLSSHESTGNSHQAAAQSAIQATRTAYADLDPETGYDIGTAPVEFVPPSTGGSPSPPPKPPVPPDADGDGIVDYIDRDITGSPPGLPSKGRNHVKWRGIKTKEGEYYYDGTGGRHVSEPVPTYITMPGEKVIKPDTSKGEADNNTRIILGRSRDFSKHMAAGSIDIVCGRMAPFPVDKYSSPGNDPDNPSSPNPNPVRVNPIFIPMVESSAMPNLPPATKPRIINASGDPTDHPGVVMDAARVYVSQMTEVDKMFGFILHPGQSPMDPDRKLKSPELSTNYSESKDKRSGQKYPTSAVVNMADKVRMYARQDIKIITGGPECKFNSQGASLDFIGGIHLIAGNGNAPGVTQTQEPIPKGEKLASALEELTDLVDKTLDLLDAGIQAQMEFNSAMMNHFHQSPLLGIPTTPSIVAQAAGIKVMADHLSRVKVGVAFIKSNMARFRLNSLNVTGDGYINSRYNTTN